MALAEQQLSLKHDDVGSCPAVLFDLKILSSTATRAMCSCVQGSAHQAQAHNASSMYTNTNQTLGEQVSAVHNLPHKNDAEWGINGSVQLISLVWPVLCRSLLPILNPLHIDRHFQTYPLCVFTQEG